MKIQKIGTGQFFKILNFVFWKPQVFGIMVVETSETASNNYTTLVFAMHILLFIYCWCVLLPLSFYKGLLFFVLIRWGCFWSSISFLPWTYLNFEGSNFEVWSSSPQGTFISFKRTIVGKWLLYMQSREPIGRVRTLTSL